MTHAVLEGFPDVYDNFVTHSTKEYTIQSKVIKEVCMKKMFGIVAILALIVGGIMVLNKTDNSQLSESRTATKLTFSIVQNEVNAGNATLLDVRTAEEFASGHFAGATNLSLQEIEAGRLPDSVKTQRLYVYCRSGNRSAQATTLLKNAGYSVITDLGGLDSVKTLGGTLIQ